MARQAAASLTRPPVALRSGRLRFHVSVCESRGCSPPPFESKPEPEPRHLSSAVIDGRRYLE
jgi:hypothetical protein